MDLGLQAPAGDAGGGVAAAAVTKYSVSRNIPVSNVLPVGDITSKTKKFSRDIPVSNSQLVEDMTVKQKFSRDIPVSNI